VNGAGEKMVTLGRVLGPWGVKGWIKVHSYTEPRENIVGFPVWILRRGDEQRVERVEQGRTHGSNQVVVKLESVADRDAAGALVGSDILVERQNLAPCEDGEFYWTDLEGLRVVTSRGEELGVVDHLIATGSNDVMVVRGDRERLIPFLLGQVVRDVALNEGVIVVDWDADF
jgi:16S rRNA processing protein RimM